MFLLYCLLPFGSVLGNMYSVGSIGLDPTWLHEISIFGFLLAFHTGAHNGSAVQVLTEFSVMSLICTRTCKINRENKALFYLCSFQYADSYLNFEQAD